jgi:hypothetical protein
VRKFGELDVWLLCGLVKFCNYFGVVGRFLMCTIFLPTSSNVLLELYVNGIGVWCRQGWASLGLTVRRKSEDSAGVSLGSRSYGVDTHYHETIDRIV